jgi:hypothetical protein
LSCGLFRAHGKEIGCRAFFIGRIAKKKRTASKLFDVHQKKNTQQRSYLPCILFLSARQRFFSHRPLAAVNKQVEGSAFAMRFWENAQQISIFAVRFWHDARQSFFPFMSY